MSRAALALSLMAAASASSQTTAPAAGGPLAAFGWFGELAGACWKGDHPTGGVSDTQCYQSHYERLIRGTIRISRGGAVVVEGDGVFAFVPSRGHVVFSQWGTGGTYGTGHMKVEGETLVFVNQMPDGTDANVRSVWRRAGADGYRVVRERKDESGWKEILAVDYRRVP